jgi:MFS family permease
MWNRTGHTAYGGVMPLYAVLAREYFGRRVMRTVFGAATMLSSIGMAFGLLAGGWVFDTFDATPRLDRMGQGKLSDTQNSPASLGAGEPMFSLMTPGRNVGWLVSR